MHFQVGYILRVKGENQGWSTGSALIENIKQCVCLLVAWLVGYSGVKTCMTVEMDVVEEVRFDQLSGHKQAFRETTTVAVAA